MRCVTTVWRARSAERTYLAPDRSICRSQAHCERATDCFKYYDFNPNNHVAEIVAYGEIEKDDNSSNSKCVTNKLKIVREISWNELLTLVNTGKSYTGYGNSGNCNSGNHNSGDCNSGDCKIDCLSKPSPAIILI